MRKQMKNFFLISWVVILFYSCDKQNIDTPQTSSYSIAESANMADSIPLGITVDGEYPMSNIRILFFFNDEKISENIIPTNNVGTFEKKLYVPYVKDIPDGIAEIQIVAKNKNFNYSVKTIPVNIVRPKFPYLTLKTAQGNFRMEPVPNEPYSYSVAVTFPTSSLNALIEAPSFGNDGNTFYFGGKTIVANALTTDSIPFQTDMPPGSEYIVSFNTRTYEAEPFLKPSFGGVEFPGYASDIAVIEHEFTQNQQIDIRGILDIDQWWIDPSFLDKVDGTYKFRAIDGKYRITADQNLKYFRIEPMNGNALADFDPVTNTGGVWINGGVGSLAGSAPAGRLGIPSISDNPTLWNAEKNIAMAPMGNGVYQIKLIANQTLFLSNVSGSNAGLAFYKNSRSKENAFTLELAQSLYGSPGSPDPSGGSARFEFNAGSSDSNGQMIISGSNRSLGNGRKYVFNIDTKFTPAKISISLE
jgi:hypothetical protein